MIDQENVTLDELYQCLDNGVVLVTGNRRLSRGILEQYDHRALKRGLVGWQTPSVMPWHSWLRKMWDASLLTGPVETPCMLLTAAQELLVWERIISSSKVQVLRPEATARQAREAWQRLQSWMLSPQLADFDYDEDTREFRQWAGTFENQCRQRGWLAEAHIASKLIDQPATRWQHMDAEILLYGFDELTPQQQALAAVLRRNGHPLRWVEISSAQGEAVSLQCEDTTDEVHSACRWARQRLKHSPAARIGIVVPDLAAKRALLLHGLHEILCPQQMLPSADTSQQPWNISLGLPLSRYTLIDTAFSLLQLAATGLSMEQLGVLLQSPCLDGAAQEGGQRAMLDRQLREKVERSVSLKTVIRWCNADDKPWHAPLLGKCLIELRSQNMECPTQTTAGQWVGWFSRLLKASGWAADRTLTSEEYQALEAWRDVLAQFSTLDEVAGNFSYTEALAQLQRLCHARIFQPRSGPASLQVLGLYEAIGQHFDYLWVMGLHDGAWPPAPHPSPFIPLPLQRRHGMPHADQSRELTVAASITRRLRLAADTVVMSYPSKQAEEHLRASPLIANLTRVDRVELDLWQGDSWQSIVRRQAVIQELDDDPAPPLDKGRASGGSGIFKSQSLCPFRAFAEYRLGARPMRMVEPGLDSMQRGTLFHRVMELFWQSTQNHAALVAMDEQQRVNAVSTVIEQALDEMAQKYPDTLKPRFRGIESSRLQELALQWLQLEEERVPFSAIEFEKEITVAINGIELHLWLDRIDELADKRQLIIDYKTGTVNPAQWFGERPEEPQLPLYSSVVGEEKTIAAVLYAQLKTGKLAFSGVVAEAGLVPGLPPSRKGLLQEATESWPNVLQQWRQTVYDLAADFRDGRAAVDPKAQDTCSKSYCTLSALCRVAETDASLRVVDAGEPS